MDLKHTHGSYQNSIMNMRIKDFFYYNVINVVVFLDENCMFIAMVLC